MGTYAYSVSHPQLLSACLDYQYGEEDICPNCGRFGKLSEASGWCIPCTKAQRICISCGTEIPESHDRIICWDCKQEQWLRRYGDLIEFVMLSGVAFTRAVSIVKDAVRPICVVCGGPIKGGTPGESLFCSATPRCKRARLKYRRLLNNGTAQQAALETAIQLRG